MIRSALLLALLSGCGSSFGPPPDVAEGAPGDLADANVFLFARSDANDELAGRAVVVIANGPQTCRKIAEEPIEEAQEILDAGSALRWSLRYENNPPTTGTSEGVDGLWYGGGDTDDGYGHQRREALVEYTEDGRWQEAILPIAERNQEAWIRIDSEDDEAVVGEFGTPFWSGEFRAESCGEWPAAVIDTIGFY